MVKNNLLRVNINLILFALLGCFSACGNRVANINTEVDFVHLFDKGKYEASKPDYVHAARFEIGDYSQWGIFQHAPCKLRFKDIFLGPEAKIEFSIGVAPGAWGNAGDGIRFQIYIEPDEGEPSLVYSRYIDPKNHPEHRCWFNEEIELHQFENTTSTIRFETLPGENIDAKNADSDWGIWGSPRILSKGRPVPAKKTERPNIVLITFDTVRADYLGCYGNQWIQTPAIDALAQNGILFEKSYSASCYTNPAHLSIFTSVHPFVHGITDNAERLNRQLPSLPFILRELGYTTQAVMSVWHLDNIMTGLKRGFDIYDKPSEKIKIRPDSMTTSAAIELMEKQQGRPFFLWLHYFNPHTPYEADGNYHKMYYKGDPESPAHHSMDNAVFPFGAAPPWAEGFRDLEYFKKEYGAEITSTDVQIGRLMESMRKMQITDNTIVILTADHGENFGERGIYFDHWTMHNQDTHVPLIVSYPKLIPSGMRIEQSVSGIDIAPTILDLIGESNHPIAQDMFTGDNLKPLWNNPKKRLRDIHTADAAFGNAISAWDDKYKIIWELQTRSFTKQFSIKTDRVWIIDRINDHQEFSPLGHFHFGANTNEAPDKMLNVQPFVNGDLAKIKQNASQKSIPTPEELSEWIKRDKDNANAIEIMQNDPDFQNSIIKLLDRLVKRMSEKDIGQRIQSNELLSEEFGSVTEKLAPIDPAMIDHLRSLGYAQ
jgi:arylsulfatase A-like enzyme